MAGIAFGAIGAGTLSIMTLPGTSTGFFSGVGAMGVFFGASTGIFFGASIFSPPLTGGAVGVFTMPPQPPLAQPVLQLSQPPWPHELRKRAKKPLLPQQPVLHDDWQVVVAQVLQPWSWQRRCQVHARGWLQVSQVLQELLCEWV